MSHYIQCGYSDNPINPISIRPHYLIQSIPVSRWLVSLTVHLAPTGALEEGILCVRPCVRVSLSSKEHKKGVLESLRWGPDASK